MKTDDLIRALAHDDPRSSVPLAARLWMALAIGGSIAIAVFVVRLGVRPDLDQALLTWRYLAKLGIAATCFVLALWAVAQAARPEVGFRDVLVRLLVPPALLGLASALELLTVAPSEWLPNAVGRYSSYCLYYVPLLAIAPLVALLAALRSGAPRSPGLTGAIAGLLAGGLAATIYALHCPDDSPLFFALWYTTGMALMVLLGAVIGSRVLRW
jgi:hypothetical protein